MERCLGAGGLPSGAATLRLGLAVARAVATTATNLGLFSTARRGCYGIRGRLWSKRFRKICIRPLEHYYYLRFLLAATSSPDASQDIGAQQTDRKDDQGKGHDQVDQVTDDRANLELSRTDLDGERRNALARRRRRGKERHKDTVIQGLEERSHDTSKIKRCSQNDDVLGIQHLLNQLECF